MTQVWVTRSEPGASALADALSAAGFSPILEPIIDVRATGLKPPSNNASMTVFLSSHAVRFACAGGWRPPSPIAVGPTTAAALERYGIDASVPENHDSEGILKLIRSQFLHVDEFLIVCGKNSRSLLRESLVEDQKKVHEWQVYERHTSRSASRVQLNPGDWICAASHEGIAAVASVWDVRCSIEKSDIGVVVPSARVAQACKSLGFKNTHVSSGATVEATLSTLRTVGAP